MMNYPLKDEFSARVRNLQRALNAFGANLDEDGIYGKNTKEVLGLLYMAQEAITRTMSVEGIDFLVQEEGLKLAPYRDSKGKPTIGVGSTFYEDGTPVRITDKPITRERALQLFVNVRKIFEDAVNNYVTSNINQNQFDALVSLCYNIGVTAFKNSTVVQLVNNNPNDPLIRDAFKMWRNSGGQPVLLKRRIREGNLYFK